MNKYFGIILIIFSCGLSTAQPAKKIDFDKIYKVLSKFSEKKLSIEKDLPETKKIVKLLLLIDPYDPPRDAASNLCLSYDRYQRIYHQAFLEMKDKSNEADKKRLDQIEQFLNGSI